MTRWAVAAISVLCAAGCADPQAPWVGDWAITGTETHRACEGGPTSDFDLDTTWDIRIDEGGLFVAGDACRIPLSNTGPDFVNVLPFSCDTIHPSGARIMASGLGGSIERTGDRLAGSMSLEAVVDGSCVNVATTLTGRRL